MKKAHSPSVHAARVRFPRDPREFLQGQIHDFTFGFYWRKFGGFLLELLHIRLWSLFSGDFEGFEGQEHLKNIISPSLNFVECLVQYFVTLFS